ncbi:MAG TPA: hypothetical protein VEZ14_10020 [Dehalococcoidia bacterium]|nr:hypothetical protein [Dehalococcoidia bacterium]
MPDVDALFSADARRFYNLTATPNERTRIDAIITRICASPDVDYETRFPFGSIPRRPDGVIYNDGRFWIIYDVLNAWTIEIIGIGTVAGGG